MEKPIDRILRRLKEIKKPMSKASIEAGHSEGFINSLKRNKRDISFSHAMELAPVLGKSAQWIMFGTEGTNNENPTDLQIDPNLLYNVVKRLSQELVTRNKKMSAVNKCRAIAIAYEEQFRNLNGMDALKSEEIAVILYDLQSNTDDDSENANDEELGFLF
ncbi:MAG: hypothetical protein ABJO86_00790 [Lentilitoribacter sp.]